MAGLRKNRQDRMRKYPAKLGMKRIEKASPAIIGTNKRNLRQNFPMRIPEVSETQIYLRPSAKTKDAVIRWHTTAKQEVTKSTALHVQN